MVEMCRDLNELNPKVKVLAEALLEACKKEGLNIKISETYRSVERQDYLYAQGRTRPGVIVTNAKGSSMSSYHQWRLAFDVYQNVKGAEYDKNILARVGAIGQRLGLEWGGSWSSFSDTPHFQYTFGLSIADLRKGKTPPTSIVVQNEDKDYKKAIEILIDEGIIDTEAAWYPTPNIKYTEALISKITIKLSQESYDVKINLLQNLGIISEPSKWQTKQYKEEDVKWLIKKVANYLKD